MEPITVDEAVAGIPDRASVAIGRPPALALVRALIRRGARGLHVLGVPTGDIAVELLVAAGCAAVVESSGVDLGELGAAPAFCKAVEEGRIRVIDSSCPAMLMALQAGASGIPWTPVRGLTGSDLLAHRHDYRTVADPYLEGGGEIVLVPALTADVALVRARRADPAGNLVIATTYDDRLLIQASRRVIAEVETVRPGAADRLAGDEQVIPASYVDTVVVVAPESPTRAAEQHLEARTAVARG